MKLNSQLMVLDRESEVAIIDYQGLDLVCKVKDVPKDIRERTVKSLYRVSSDMPYDFLIELKM